MNIIDKLDKKMPQRIKKRRIIDQVNDIWEEYYDFEFPEDIQQDESSNNAFANLKFLQMAQNWKKNAPFLGTKYNTIAQCGLLY